VQTHRHTKTCRKKQGIKCRFHFPCPPTDKTIISHAQSDKSVLKQAKVVCDKVFSAMERIGSLSGDFLSEVTVNEVLTEANVKEAEYYTSLSTLRSKMCILYKRYANECHIQHSHSCHFTCKYEYPIYHRYIWCVGISHVIHVQTGAYNERIDEKNVQRKKGGSIKQKLKSIGNVFLTNREVPLHESIHRNLSMPLTRSNVTVKFVPTGPQENRSRTVHSNPVLDRIMQDDPNSEDIFTTGLLERYANRPDSLENNCFAYFASNYNVKSDQKSQSCR